MNREMYEQMMARLGTSSMLPPPSADYAPGGSMFPVAGKPTDEQEAAISAHNPTSLLGKLGKIVAPQTSAAMAGKGGGA